jgi:5-methyltetrahydrofolate--homocysteine methyltransferase
MNKSLALIERLRHQILLLDGANGTELIAAGLPQGRAPEWWNLEHPERITAMHRRYVEAGSDLIHTNTFGANPPKLRGVGLEGRCAEINALAVQLAHAACTPQTWLAGDMGPTGLLLPPMGETTEEELLEAFTMQAQALAEVGVDLIAIETMYDLREARSAVKAAHGTGLPVFASMTFDQKKRGFFSMMGDSMENSLQELEAAGATAVGFNCSLSSEAMLTLVREATLLTKLPLIAQPNAGQPRPTPNGVVYDATPAAFGQDIVEIINAGARAVGGCCGTTPTFIKTLRELIDARAAAGQ